MTDATWKGRPLMSLTWLELVEAVQECQADYERLVAQQQRAWREANERKRREKPAFANVVRLPIVGKINGDDEPAKWPITTEGRVR